MLNVEAMTVHFDEVRFKEIISMFAEEVEPAPEEIGFAILELEAAAEMVKDEIIEEETKISEEPVRSAAPVAAEEIEEEEEESQVEPEGHIYLEEAVEFAVESEAEELKIEVAEETKRESEIEEIEIIEKK